MTLDEIKPDAMLWSWTTCREGRVVALPEHSDGMVTLIQNNGEYFEEPAYALMPRPTTTLKQFTES